jgi:uncharacterized protein (DUF2252 family)
MDETIGGRMRRGRDARKRAPRSSHAEISTGERRDPIEIIEVQARTRVSTLVPIRHARMAASPFAFFRGAAAVMAADLANTPTSGLTVQLCGDAHASNFGLFASPERQLVFDVNDFDETLAGPWEWDVKRLVASLHIAGRQQSFGEQEIRSVTSAASARYRQSIADFAGRSNLEVWYASVQAESQLLAVGKRLDAGTAKLVSKTVTRAKSRDHIHTYSALIRRDGKQMRFVNDPPLLVRLEDLVDSADVDATRATVRTAFADYRESLSSDRRQLLDQYRPVDIAHKVVGVGSVGVQAWVMLLIGRDRGDPLFLQIKEAQRSVLEQHLAHSPYANAGQRVVAGQRAMQGSSDIMLGWHRLAGPDGSTRDFYVRQLRDWKGSFELEQMSPISMKRYGELCAGTLAHAHARSGDRIAIAAYLGQSRAFDVAVADFAAAYADENQRDYASFLAAIAAGRIPAGLDPALRVRAATSNRETR